MFTDRQSKTITQYTKKGQHLSLKLQKKSATTETS